MGYRRPSSSSSNPTRPIMKSSPSSLDEGEQKQAAAKRRSSKKNNKNRAKPRRSLSVPDPPTDSTPRQEDELKRSTRTNKPRRSRSSPTSDSSSPTPPYWPTKKEAEASRPARDLKKSEDNNKSVAFHPRVTLRKSLHIRDYTPEERQATWYSITEIDQLRKERKSIIRQLLHESGEPTTSGSTSTSLSSAAEDNVATTTTTTQKPCVWGFEALVLQQGQKKQDRTKIKARKAVFRQQTMQRLLRGPTTVSDHDGGETTTTTSDIDIAHVYAAICKSSHLMASFLGNEYATAVQANHKEEELKAKNSAKNHRKLTRKNVRPSGLLSKLSGHEKQKQILQRV